jgi:hypothetical protein
VKIAPYMIMPTNKFRTYWNILIIFLLIYTATYMPYDVAFIDTPSTLSNNIDYAVDALFSIDIILTFFTTYEEPDGTIRHRLPDIARSYIKSWFFLDLIAWYFIS